MRTLFIALLITFASLHSNDQEIKKFIQNLSSQQKELLDKFFRTLVKDSFSGYVLYGDKPICIEAYGLSPDTGALTGFDDKEPILVNGFNLWQELNLQVNDKKYFFLSFDFDHSYRHFICINRKAFIQTVNDNLSLFRYVLGPTLTAEDLLAKLIQSKDQFYTVLKDDNALLGILLGYGTQNALLHSRKEFISDAFSYDRVEDFPLISRKNRMKLTILPRTHKKHPSLGFSSLIDEINAIKKGMVVSRSLFRFNSCKIPYFGCEPNSEETKSLLDTYGMNRDEIIKITQSEGFLEHALNKFFATTADDLDIPTIPKQKIIDLPVNKEELLAQMVRYEMSQEKYFQENYSAEFIKGIAARKNNQTIDDSLEHDINHAWDTYLLERDVECCENLQNANDYFRELALQKKLTPLIPKKVYYKTILKGKGPSASSKLKSVSFHYTYSILNQPGIYLGSVIHENIEHIIPGIAHVLFGMKRGEQREVYIHPEYGYGEESYLPPNIVLLTKIELVDFEEGDQERPIAPMQQLKERNFRELSSKLDQENKKKFFVNGLDFWNHYKDIIDHQKFLKAFNKKNEPETAAEKQKDFLVDLNGFRLYQSIK